MLGEWRRMEFEIRMIYGAQTTKHGDTGSEPMGWSHKFSFYAFVRIVRHVMPSYRGNRDMQTRLKGLRTAKINKRTAHHLSS